ncbi:hypothetical protein L208DRAFT_1392188, partial [Tricholoma matsutake]
MNSLFILVHFLLRFGPRFGTSRIYVNSVRTGSNREPKQGNSRKTRPPSTTFMVTNEPPRVQRGPKRCVCFGPLNDVM